MITVAIEIVNLNSLERTTISIKSVNELQEKNFLRKMVMSKLFV